MQPSSRWSRTTLVVVLLLLVSCCTAKITIIAPQEGRQPAPVPAGDASTVSTEDFEATSTEDPDSASTEDFGSTSTEVTTLVGDHSERTTEAQPGTRKPLTNYSAPEGKPRRACPRMEDIHPCKCVEFNGITPGSIETVVTCKNIRNKEVLVTAVQGFRQHTVNYFVIDTCNIPPFPNKMLNNVKVGWMEIVNSTVTMEGGFFSCSKDCL
uniref:Putative secreted protein n=1 Tax=Ixodes ricinus TaxID=34613 RepID=V5GK97_IXORI